MMYHKDLLLYQSSRRWGVCFSFACVCHDVAMFAAIAAVRENSCWCHFETLRTDRQRFGIMLWNFSDGSTLQLERGARYAVLVNHYFTVYFMWFASGWQVLLQKNYQLFVWRRQLNGCDLSSGQLGLLYSTSRLHQARVAGFCSVSFWVLALLGFNTITTRVTLSRQIIYTNSPGHRLRRYRFFYP